MEELNSGPPKTNPSSGREEDLNPGPPDYKSSALTTRPRCLLIVTQKMLHKKCSDTVVGLELLVCLSTGLRCSLKRSLSLRLVSPMYCL